MTGLTSLERAAALLSCGVLGAVGLGAVTGGDPDRDSPTLCPFALITGRPCPFCGMTHALMALGRGHVRRSVDFHPLGPAVLLVALTTLVMLWRARRSDRHVRWPAALAPAIAVAFAVTWVATLSSGRTIT